MIIIILQKIIKKPVTMNMNVTTIENFKAISDEPGIPYQVLMNYYLEPTESR